MGEQMGSKCPELTRRWDTNDFNLSVYFNVCQPLLYVFVGKYPLHDQLAGGRLQLHPSPDEHYFRLLQVGCCSCLAENGLATAGASPSLIFSHQLLQVHLHLGTPLFLWIQLSTLSQNQALSRWQKRPHQVYSTDSWNSLLIDPFVEHFLFTTFLTLFIYVCQMSFWKKLLFREPCLCLKPLALLTDAGLFSDDSQAMTFQVSQLGQLLHCWELLWTLPFFSQESSQEDYSRLAIYFLAHSLFFPFLQLLQIWIAGCDEKLLQDFMTNLLEHSLFLELTLRIESRNFSTKKKHIVRRSQGKLWVLI